MNERITKSVEGIKINFVRSRIENGKGIIIGQNLS